MCNLLAQEASWIARFHHEDATTFWYRSSHELSMRRESDGNSLRPAAQGRQAAERVLFSLLPAANRTRMRAAR
jgi:hypothetical protein